MTVVSHGCATKPRYQHQIQEWLSLSIAKNVTEPVPCRVCSPVQSAARNTQHEEHLGKSDHSHRESTEREIKEAAGGSQAKGEQECVHKVRDLSCGDEY